jgi:hypothetical protein
VLGLDNTRQSCVRPRLARAHAVHPHDRVWPITPSTCRAMHNLHDFGKVWCWDELEAFLGYDCAVLGEEDKDKDVELSKIQNQQGDDHKCR